MQAIATAKRLGAVVEAYDVRSATKDQVKSLGAKFIETGVSAEGAGGYARELTAEEKAKQQEVLDARIAASDAVISTASVPGRAAPRIISQAAVERMKAGSVIVDIAAEQGGNCELTRAGETVEHGGVKILGPLNLPASLPYHASEMYSRNLFNLLKPALVEGRAGDRLERRSVRRRGAHARRPDQARSRPAKRWRDNSHDRRRHSALYIHAGGIHRLRGHLAGAGDPAHAAHVRIELRAWHRLVGAMVALAAADTTLLRVIGFIGVILAAGNAVGGYVVTERMLKMFVTAGKKEGS